MLEASMHSSKAEMRAFNDWRVILPFDARKITQSEIFNSLISIYITMVRGNSFSQAGYVGLSVFEELKCGMKELFRSGDRKWIKQNIKFLYASSGGFFSGNYMYRNSLKRYFDYSYKVTGWEEFQLLSRMAKQELDLWKAFISCLADYFSMLGVWLPSTVTGKQISLKSLASYLIKKKPEYNEEFSVILDKLEKKMTEEHDLLSQFLSKHIGLKTGVKEYA